MTALDQAWRWYEDARNSLLRAHRMAEKYWDTENAPWKNDNKFGPLEKADVAQPALNALEPLDDLAVLVLFSAFESIVRSEVLKQLSKELKPGLHPVLDKAIKDAEDSAREGGIFHLLSAYKGKGHDLELINQVRRYRNWVAHGRRTARPELVNPRVAYQRLNEFLGQFFSPLVVDEGWVETER